jgi:hypothetical protein
MRTRGTVRLLAGVVLPGVTGLKAAAMAMDLAPRPEGLALDALSEDAVTAKTAIAALPAHAQDARLDASSKAVMRTKQPTAWGE